MKLGNVIRLEPVGWVNALVTLGVGLGLWILPIGDGLVHFSFDLLTVLRRGPVPGDLVVVYMDEISRRDLEQPSNDAWDRRLHAGLLHRLHKERTRLVAFDVVFSTPGADPEADARLAEALKAHGQVVLAADLAVRVREGQSRTRSATIALPVEPLRSAAAGWGLANMQVESDLAIRQHLPHDPELPGLAWVAAKQMGAESTQRVPVRARWLHYYGVPGSLRGISYNQAFDPDGAPAGFFRDKIVFIGAQQSTAFLGQGKDEFGTPFTRFTKRYSPGVEVQATAFLNLMRRDWWERVPAALELGLLVLAGVVLGVGLTNARFGQSGDMGVLGAALAPAVVAVGGLLLVPLLAVVLHWLAGVWFGWMLIEVQVVAGLVCASTSNSLRAYVDRRTAQLRAENLQLQRDKLALEKQTLEHSLSLHLSPARVKQLLERPELLRPGTERMMVTILFSDIAVFTKLAETLGSDDLVNLLNSYYETALDCVRETDGTVLQVLGDAIFAVWNAPFSQPDHPRRACQSALLLANKLDRYCTGAPGLPVRTRIGLNTGIASVGNVGSSTRFSYVAVGDSVILASRLEGLNKHLGTQILATREVLKTAADMVVSRKIGYFRLKGFGRLVEIHEILGPQPAVEPVRAWIATFESALTTFASRQFDAAARLFQQVIDLRLRAEDQLKVSPEFRAQDGPSLFYLKQIEHFRLEHFRHRPPGPEWVGEIVMDEK